MRLSIRYQLLVPLLALVVGVFVLSAWTAWASASRARQQIARQLGEVADTVQGTTFPLNMQTLRIMKGLSGAEFLLCDAHRQPLYTSEGQPLTTMDEVPSELPEAPTPPEHLPLGEPVQIGATEYFCRGVVLNPDVAGNRVIFIFYPESLWREALAAAVRPALIVGIIGGTLSILLTLVATQRITRRIRKLGRRTRLIADGDFSPMALPRENDELRDLGQAVNEMAERLASFQESQRTSERLRLLGQVSGGLAHQLRNGVAGAKLAMQLHLREHVASEPLDVALRQLVLIEMQLKRFLDLGKRTALRLETCDLVRVVDDSVTLVRPRCQHAGIELRWSPPSMNLQLRADAGELSQVLLNVLTNAIEAAGPGGWVEAQVGTMANRAFVEVYDSGPGVDPVVAGRLFEPFVTGKPEGVGLGLAVAKQIVVAHGGSIVWTRDDTTTCFRLELPVVDEKGVGSQKSEIGNQKSEIRSQRSEVGGP